MNIKCLLQKKWAARAVLLILLLSAVGMTNAMAQIGTGLNIEIGDQSTTTGYLPYYTLYNYMSYTVGVNNTIEVGWNTPTGYDLLDYNICEWHPGAKDGDLTVIDYVGASVNTYTCSESQFDHGMIVIQGVEAGKTESRLLSNRSLDYVGLGENTGNAFRLYPNPTKDRITIEGTGTAIITNALGQTILTKDIDGKESIELPKGLYFVKMGGVARKIVVE